MTCEEVRALLPAYLDRDLHSVGEIEVHLASCERCSAELASYRALLVELRELRERGEEPDPLVLQRTLAMVPSPTVARRMIGSVQAHPVVYAVASIGGAAVGATALAVAVSRRRANRAAAGSRS
jgi:anti-sigma factor RsiW